VASGTSQGMVAVSSPGSSFVTGGSPVATPPILVVKSRDDIEKFVQALPLLTGALVSASGRAGAKKLMGAAGRRLAAAKNARVAGKATSVPKGNTLNALRGKKYTGMAQNPVKVSGYKNIPEGLELPEGHPDWGSYLDSSEQVQGLSSTPAREPKISDYYDETPGTPATGPSGQQVAGAKRRALQAEVDKQGLTETSTTQTQVHSGTPADPLSADEKQALGAGAVGVTSGTQQMASQSMAANQQKQQEEMKRIENIADEGRSKSTTGGGQVAVSA